MLLPHLVFYQKIVGLSALFEHENFVENFTFLNLTMEHSCRLYKWESNKENESHELDLNCEEEALAELKDVGSQLAVSFSGEGSILATGGEVSRYPLLVEYWYLCEVFLCSLY
jgi:hypothetical protein